MRLFKHTKYHVVRDLSYFVGNYRHISLEVGSEGTVLSFHIAGYCGIVIIPPKNLSAYLRLSIQKIGRCQTSRVHFRLISLLYVIILTFTYRAWNKIFVEGGYMFICFWTFINSSRHGHQGTKTTQTLLRTRD